MIEFKDSKGIPISEAVRNQWAEEMLAQVMSGESEYVSTSSGDSKVTVSRDCETGTIRVEDVVLRRYAFIFALPPQPNFLALVSEELERAREKHPGKQNSLHEGYAVLLEEVEEFWAEVMKRTSARSPERIREELVQIAAMAMRTAEDLGYVKSSE